MTLAVLIILSVVLLPYIWTSLWYLASTHGSKIGDKGPCADPESFKRKSNFDNVFFFVLFFVVVFFELMSRSKYHLFRTIIGPTAGMRIMVHY